MMLKHPRIYLNNLKKSLWKRRDNHLFFLLKLNINIPYGSGRRNVFIIIKNIFK